MSVSSSGNLRKSVSTLQVHYGEISWWPGDRDEVVIGAILTRQTRWENVIRALRELRARGLCPVAAPCPADLRDIEEYIRCTGFFRDTHAYIVEYAKEILRIKRCDTCILVNLSG